MLHSNTFYIKLNNFFPTFKTLHPIFVKMRKCLSAAQFRCWTWNIANLIPSSTGKYMSKEYGFWISSDWLFHFWTASCLPQLRISTSKWLWFKQKLYLMLNLLFKEHLKFWKKKCVWIYLSINLSVWINRLSQNIGITFWSACEKFSIQTGSE